MLVISKMKSFMSQTLSTFSIHPTKPTTSLFLSSASKSLFFDSKPFLSLSFLNLETPRTSSRRSSTAFIHSQATQMGDCRPPLSGEIHVIVGPMFAGKTTTLVRRIQSERGNGRSVAVIKSNKDTRYGLDSIVTHDGLKLPCYALSSLSSFKQNLGRHAYDQVEVIGIDEAQFFDDLYEFCREAADIDGKTVIVAGLDGDYLRRRFGYVLDIIPLADSVTKLCANCEICGGRANFTLRKTQESEREVIGGAEVYMPVCRHHYVGGQAVIEAARNVVESKEAEYGFHA